MRIFIIILIYISYGFISFGEIVFRDDFNNTNNDYSPWSITYNNNASSNPQIYNGWAFVLFNINSSSMTDVLVRRTFLGSPNKTYTLILNGVANPNAITPIRVYSGNTSHAATTYSFDGTLTVDERTNTFSLSNLSQEQIVTLELQVGSSEIAGWDWIELQSENNEVDQDSDGLSDYDEINVHLTDPNDEDSDDDGLTDGDEVIGYLTDPNDEDSDDDGLTDGDEVIGYFTDPNDEDSDDDGLTDGQEITNGTNPNDPNSPGTSNENRFELLRANGSIIYSSIENGQTIDLNALGNRELNVKYYPENNLTTTVEFQLNGEIIMIDNQNPFYLGGEDGKWLPSKGSYTLTATERNSSGQLLTVQTQTFDIIDKLDHRLRKIKLNTGGSNDLIRIEMKKHSFPFGSMFKYEARNDPGFKETFVSNFNYSVHGNMGKWYANQPDWWGSSPHNQNFQQPGNHRFGPADTTYNYLESQNIPMRGHTFYWGMINNNQSSPSNQMWDPDWVEARVANNPQDGLYWIEQRARAVANHWVGKIEEWDFNNEMGHGDWYRDTFTETGPYGLTITKRMADWALDENPNLKLYHNDYGILMNNSYAQTFKNLVKTIKSEGVPIDGIGCQGHWNNQYPDATTIKRSLDILDDFGAPIKITEFDIAVGNGDDIYNNDADIEQREAQGLEEAFRAFFEHPAVHGIILWGFQETHHWRPEGALYYPDWSPSPQGLKYRSLVYDEWWTEADVRTSGNGVVDISAFPGDYTITINENTSYDISIPPGYKQAEINISASDISLTQDSEIKLVKPVHQNIYAEMETIECQLDFSNNGIDVNLIEFYVDGQKMKSDYEPPYDLSLQNSTIGFHDVWAKCIYSDGSEELSVTNRIEVKAATINQNILTNGGFEDGLDQWTSQGTTTLEIIQSPVKSGANAVSSSNRTAEWMGVKSSVNLMDILEEGVSYTISCYARVDSGSHPVKIVEKSTPLDGIASYNQIASSSCNSTEWTKIEGQLLYYDLSQLSLLEFYVSGAPSNVILYVDDIMLESAPVNILDTDDDGLQDSWEDYYFSSLSNYTGQDDPDADGSNNTLEFRIGTNPIDPSSSTQDTDGDGLFDYDEINIYSTNPNNNDSDGDGFSDVSEVINYQTNPNNNDSDNDGLPDGFELSYAGNINMNVDDDMDNDGFTNYEEWIADTNPIDELSRLRILVNSSTSSNVVFLSSSNREYRVEFSTNLLDNSWTATNQWIIGNDPETTISIPFDEEYQINRIRVRLPEN